MDGGDPAPYDIIGTTAMGVFQVFFVIRDGYGGPSDDHPIGGDFYDIQYTPPIAQRRVVQERGRAELSDDSCKYFQE